MQALLLFVLPACLAVSFLCSGMEAGLFTLGRWRIAQQMRAGQLRAARLYAYLQNAENFLWTVLIGNTIALFCSMWIIAGALLRVCERHHLLFWLSFLAAGFVFYAFCDLLPKTLFRKFPNRLCLLLSAPFRLLHILLSPLVALVEGVATLLLRWSAGRVYKGQVFSNRNELRLLMEDTTEALTTEKRALVNRVFDMNNVSVGPLAIPFGRIPSLKSTDLVQEAVARFSETPHNVLPVWNAGKQQVSIAGFLEVRELIFKDGMKPTDSVSAHMSPALFLDENLRLHEALRRMQRTGQRLAVVMARDRRQIGLITLEQILKFIFGEVKL